MDRDIYSIASSPRDEASDEETWESPKKVSLFGKDSSTTYQVLNTTLKTLLNKRYTDAKIGDLVDRIRRDGKYALRIRDRSKYNANFVLDTGAEVHVISDKSLFRSYGGNKTTTLSWGDASSIEIKGEGSVYIQFIDTKKSILLNNCIYMLEIGLNIISKGVLRLDAYFEQYRLTLLEEETKEIVSVGEKVGNLYFLPIKVIKGEIERVFLITKKDISLDYL